MCRQWQEALLFLDEMRAAGIGPSLFCLNRAISACELVENLGSTLSRLYDERNRFIADDLFFSQGAFDMEDELDPFRGLSL
mmetsp:Transcript_81763/g.142224  ORF Transcript_81763/g.142224 Transcript_81763/m.142224 type:complete len:81 (-) Transcript_81763:80-322(-)